MNSTPHDKFGAKRGHVLFAEDFDIPPTRGGVPEPEIIQPTFTQADLEAARQQAWQAGHDAAAAHAAEETATALRAAIATIAAGMTEARAEAAAAARQNAEELARLLFDSVAAAFPSLCAAYGEMELRALVRTLLPALQQEPSLSIRINPAHAAAIQREIAQAEPDLVRRIELTPCETIPLGDTRIVWRAGQATRDAAGVWQQIVEILAPAGLVSFAATKEPEHVE